MDFSQRLRVKLINPLTALTSFIYKTSFLQNSEMLRDGGKGHFKRLRKRSRRSFTTLEEFQNFTPHRVRDGFKNPSCFFHEITFPVNEKIIKELLKCQILYLRDYLNILNSNEKLAAIVHFHRGQMVSGRALCMEESFPSEVSRNPDKSIHHLQMSEDRRQWHESLGAASHHA